MKEVLAVYGILRNNTGPFGVLFGGAIYSPTGLHYPAWFSEADLGTDLPVRVEVYKLSTEQINYLDAVEGVPYLFERVRKKILTDNGAMITAWVFIGGKGIMLNTDSLTLIEGGDWLKFTHGGKNNE